MKKVHIFLMAVCLSVLLLSGFSCRSQTRADYPYQPVTFTSVHFSDAFWLPRLETNRKVTIPFALDQSEEAGRLKNFEIAGGAAEGEFCSIYPFDDSDVYKIIEGASYALNIRNDLLNGVTVIKGQAFMAIPYYAWAHRGPGEMAVWLPREEGTARPLQNRK